LLSVRRSRRAASPLSTTWTFAASADARAERRAPRRQLMDEEDGLQQLGVALRRGSLHADRPRGLGDVQHLCGLAGELAQQQRQLATLLHA